MATQVADSDTREWIAIPYEFLRDSARVEGKSRMLFNPARLAYDLAVERAGKEIGLDLYNTATDTLDRPFVGNMNWTKQLRLNLSLGNTTPSLDEFVQTMNLIYRASQGEIVLHTVQGKKLEPSVLKAYFEDKFAVRDPWRAENFDADFKVVDGILYLNSQHVYQDGKLVPQYSKPVGENVLMHNRSGISLTNYLRTPAEQGLPSKEIGGGSLYYRVPISDDNSIAVFGAGSGGASLDCSGARSYSGAVFGVGAVRHE